MEDGKILFILFIFACVVFFLVLPGYIAIKRNHAYKYIILVLGIIGVVNGVTWIIAIIWALWPQEKSIIDPVLGNVTGTGVRNVGDTLGATSVGSSYGAQEENDIREKLLKTRKLYEDKLISEDEYHQEKKRILNR